LQGNGLGVKRARAHHRTVQGHERSGVGRAIGQCPGGCTVGCDMACVPDGEAVNLLRRHWAVVTSRDLSGRDAPVGRIRSRSLLHICPAPALI
jgi:hypothetical protein